jgi:hypothetical protein
MDWSFTRRDVHGSTCQQECFYCNPAERDEWLDDNRYACRGQGTCFGEMDCLMSGTLI